jgi:hypothetical protein
LRAGGGWVFLGVVSPPAQPSAITPKTPTGCHSESPRFLRAEESVSSWTEVCFLNARVFGGLRNPCACAKTQSFSTY